MPVVGLRARHHLIPDAVPDMICFMGRTVLPEVTANSEEDFADLRFSLESLRCDVDGFRRMAARGLHRGERVGFAASLSPAWERQDLEGGLPLYWGRVDLISLGAESDAFLRVVDEVYGTEVRPEKMQEQVSFIAVSLEGDPLHVEDYPVKLKLFFESDSEERDADFYLNIDPRDSSIEFREKDTDYRRGIVLCLMQPQ